MEAGKAPGFAVEPVHPAGFGGNPQVVARVFENKPDPVAAQAGGIIRIETISFEGSGFAVHQVQPAAAGPNPKIARVVFEHGPDGVMAQAGGADSRSW